MDRAAKWQHWCDARNRLQGEADLPGNVVVRAGEQGLGIGRALGAGIGLGYAPHGRRSAGLAELANQQAAHTTQQWAGLGSPSTAFDPMD